LLFQIHNLYRYAAETTAALELLAAYADADEDSFVVGAVTS
jgi:hypothetical protein